MYAGWMKLCKVVVAMSMAAFVAGWVVNAKVSTDALDQPQQAEGIYEHPLPTKRGHKPHYLTNDQKMLLDFWQPVMMGAWIFAFAGFVTLGALDDARRDAEKAKEDAYPQT
jgi:hypothetical protein